MSDQPVIYRPHTRYVLYAGVSLVMAAAFVWLLWRQYEGGALLFLVVALGGAIWSVANLLSRVEVDATSLVVRVPLLPARRIDLRQLSEVTESGRFLPALVILYYPLRADGLVDLDDLHSQILPAVEDQADLLEFLQGKTPH
jgi:hypothetical protein